MTRPTNPSDGGPRRARRAAMPRFAPIPRGENRVHRAGQPAASGSPTATSRAVAAARYRPASMAPTGSGTAKVAGRTVTPDGSAPPRPPPTPNGSPTTASCTARWRRLRALAEKARRDHPGGRAGERFDPVSDPARPAHFVKSQAEGLYTKMELCPRWSDEARHSFARPA